MFTVFRKKEDFGFPFTYIAAMPRSGSTMLAGLLSKAPMSHFFSELGLNRGMTHGFDQLAKINEKFTEVLGPYARDPDGMIRVFGRKILPQLFKVFSHIGVKECFHDNWQLYLKLPNKVRFIVLARDPRDVMLSVLDYGDRAVWHREMWADRGDHYVASRHNEIWAQQQEMIDRCNALPVRYEDLCQKADTFAELCRFCDLPLDKPAAAGGMIETYPWRLWEIEKHGANDIGTGSVFRWKAEPKTDHLHRAKRVGQLMRNYCKFWGYEY
jgi:hypothetical protein